jgi:hypothetical protein
MDRIAIAVIILLSLLVFGCDDSRKLPEIYMPILPIECKQVLDFNVEPLPSGKSTATKLSINMAKEGGIRQQEHEVAKVCAQYAIQAEATMKDAEFKDKDGSTTVLGKIVNNK